jgi:hypothetical protein
MTATQQMMMMIQNVNKSEKEIATVLYTPKREIEFVCLSSIKMSYSYWYPDRIAATHDSLTSFLYFSTIVGSNATHGGG